MFVVYDVIVTLATCRGCHLQRGNIRKGKLLACATMVVKRDRIACLTFNYISVAPSKMFFCDSCLFILACDATRCVDIGGGLIKILYSWSQQP
jgi:hypothetical protein